MATSRSARRGSRPGPPPSLTVHRIAAAAVELADTEGLAAVTMRSLAAAVGVSAPGLYRYVTSRDELVGHMVDLVSADLRHPPPSGNWYATSPSSRSSSGHCSRARLDDRGGRLRAIHGSARPRPPRLGPGRARRRGGTGQPQDGGAGPRQRHRRALRPRPDPSARRPSPQPRYPGRHPRLAALLAGRPPVRPEQTSSRTSSKASCVACWAGPDRPHPGVGVGCARPDDRSGRTAEQVQADGGPRTPSSCGAPDDRRRGHHQERW